MEKLSAKQLKQKYSQGIRDFSNKNFSRENLNKLSLTNANFVGCDFTSCCIREADFSGSNLHGAKFERVVAGLSWFKRFQSVLIVYLFIFFIGLVAGVGGFLLESIGSPSLIKKAFIPAILVFILLEIISFSLIRTSVNTVKKSQILQPETNPNSFRFDKVYSVLSVLMISSFLFLLVSLNLVIEEIIGFLWLALAFAIMLIGLAFAVTMFLAGISLVVAGPLILSMAACGILVISGISIAMVLDSERDANQFYIYVIAIASAFVSFIPTYIINEALYGNPQFKWIKDVAIRFPTYLGSTSFRKANLQNATFEGAYLSNVDFRQADLTNTFWYMSEKLNTCRLEKTLLENDLVVDLVVTLNGRNKVYDNISMIGINLEGVKLNSASLVNTDFSDANLKGATLTGACIKDWNINPGTRFDNIICEYIYRGAEYTERYPVDHNKMLEPGDFVRLVQQASGTLDLIFRDGIDWKSLLQTLQNLQEKYGSEDVSIRAIEKKFDQSFVVKVDVPPEVQQATLEREFWQKYEKSLKEYEEKLRDKDRDIYWLSKNFTDFKEIVRAMAEKQQINYNAPIYGSGYTEGTTHYHEAHKQSLAQAADEIQGLLKQLEKSNPGSTNREIADQAIQTIKGTPSLRERAISAAKEGALEVIKQTTVGKVVAGAIEGWIKPEV